MHFDICIFFTKVLIESSILFLYMRFCTNQYLKMFFVVSNFSTNCLKNTKKSDERLRLPLIDGEVLKIILKSDVGWPYVERDTCLENCPGPGADRGGSSHWSHEVCEIRHSGFLILDQWALHKRCRHRILVGKDLTFIQAREESDINLREGLLDGRI